MLGLGAILTHPRTIQEVATKTGVWQHQIRYGSAVREIARSTEPGAPSGSKDEWKVQEVVETPAGPRIDETIAWIDKNVSRESVANILMVPAFYLTAFWLRSPPNDEVVIVDMPAGLHNLKFFHRYDAEDFLRLLSELKPLGMPSRERPMPT